MAERAVALTDNDAYYDHRNLAGLMASIVRTNAICLARSAQQEIDVDLSIHDSVTRLSWATADQLARLACLLDYDRPDVLIDRRLQTVEIHFQRMPDEDYAKALKALAELRQVRRGEVVEHVLSGHPVALPETIENGTTE